MDDTLIAPQTYRQEEQARKETGHEHQQDNHEPGVRRAALDHGGELRLVNNPANGHSGEHDLESCPDRVSDHPDQGEADAYVSEDGPASAKQGEQTDQGRREEHRGEHDQEARGLHAARILGHRLREFGVPSTRMNDQGN